jgi:hypothetical protein
MMLRAKSLLTLHFWQIGYGSAIAGMLLLSGCGTFANRNIPSSTAWNATVEESGEQFDTRGFVDYQARQKAERVPRAKCAFG